jgi:proteic killer suppression protein
MWFPMSNGIGKSRRIPPGVQRVALRKLKYMNNAMDLNDLRMPPGNRLEALTGDREGQHSATYKRCTM